MTTDVTQRADHRPRGNIAIIGMAALFPGAPDLTTYWQNILGKVDAVSDPPADAWDPAVHYDPDSTERDRVYCKRGGYLSPIAYFNPLEHGVMPRAVDGGEPDHWLSLNVARDALIDAGYFDRLDAAVRHRTAVIIGKTNFVNRGLMNVVQHSVLVEQTVDIIRSLHPEFAERELLAIREELKGGLPPFTTDTVPGFVSNIVAGRIANRLDLMGPSYTVDAACASSLIAVQAAMRDLLTDECDLALVGGAQVITPLPILSVFCAINALSRRQQIRPFDKDADGTILGEGVGMVVLKRLEDAERDGDRIYAVLKGVGVASDGRAVSIMAPRIEGEELALRRAYDIAGVDPATVELIEAHGTGTLAGDAAELDALARVFAGRQGLVPHRALGTVKSMIGHSMPAAGIAGLIKTALALYHRVLPPTLNVTEPNVHLDRDGSELYVNTEPRPWIHGDSQIPRRAGVNAFGFGGINAHAVLEEYAHAKEAVLPSHQLTWESEMLILQAGSAPELMEEIDRLLAFLEQAPVVTLKDLAYSLNTQMPGRACRLAVVASNLGDLQGKLEKARQRLADPKCRQIKDKSGLYYFSEPLAVHGKVAVLFPGEGAQYVHMLADLCMHFPEVRAAFDQMDHALQGHSRGYRCSDFVFPPALLSAAERSLLEQRLWDIEGAMEAVLAANQGLRTLMTELGLRPDVIIGHSTGEYSAMRAAGLLGLDDDTIFARFVQDLNRGYREALTAEGVPPAGMLAIGASRDQVASIVARVSGSLYLAMDNCPHQAVIVGDHAAVEEARALVQEQGLIYEFLRFDRAYHTPLFQPYTAYIQEALAGVPVSPPRVPIYSCATAAPYPVDAAAIRQLVLDQWSAPVEFRQTVETLYREGVRLFVEVGPRGNLTSFVEDILRGRPFCAAPVNVQHRSGITQLNHCLALLTAHGVDLDLIPLYRRRAPQVVAWDGSAPLATPRNPGMKLVLGYPIMHLSPALAAELRQGAPACASAPLPSQHEESRPELPPPASTTIDAPVLPALSPQPVDLIGQGTPPALLEQTVSLLREEDAPLLLEGDPGLVSWPPGTPHLPDEWGWVPDGATDTAMSLYMQTMDQFLAVEDQVMRAYLAGPTDQPPQDPSGDDGGQPLPKHAVTEWPEPPDPHDPFGALAHSHSVQPIIDRASEGEMPSPPKTAAISEAQQVNEDARLHITAQLLALVSERTGYPPEMLDLQCDLEADLGIDSIKRVEILGAFRRQSTEAQQIELERLTTRRTLRQVIDLVAPPAPPTMFQPAVPVAGMAGLPDTVAYPLLGRVVSWTPGRELVAQRTFDLAHDLYLTGHVLGRAVSDTDPSLQPLAMLPLAISMEVLAEAALCLMPGHTITGLHNLFAFRWIAFDDGQPQTLQVTARVVQEGAGRVLVQLRNLTEDSQAEETLKSPVVEATVVLASSPLSAPAAHRRPPSNQRPSRWPDDRLYTDVLFHGPPWQGIAGIVGTGSDGIVARLTTLPVDGFLRDIADPRFVLDPAMLDAAGQVIGCWMWEHLTQAKVGFPFRLDTLEVYGRRPPTGASITCMAAVELVGARQVCADIDLIGPDGHLWMRLGAWQDKRVEVPPHLQQMILWPREAEAAAAWSEPTARLTQPQFVQCRRVSGAFADDQGFWKLVWAHVLLSRKERERFRQLHIPEVQQLSWLAGQAAAKEAVRQVLRLHYGCELLPADIEVSLDGQARLIVGGAWVSTVPAVPLVSLAYSEDEAVALATLPEGALYVGIGVDRLGPHSRAAAEKAYSSGELSILARLPEDQRGEWAVRGRCAKEAVARALGDDPLSAAQTVLLTDVDAAQDLMSLQVRGYTAASHPGLAGSSLAVYTGRHGDLIVATTLCTKAAIRSFH